ncbi:hypothetical protein Goklo_020560, partial [Gossypium klotzschianum]|nr:hypothetical protein [Gossypium klotzschianum]
MVVATTCLLCGHDTESFDHIVRECLPTIELWMDLQVRHIHCEGNSCVGHLANLAQNIERGLVRLETSPMSIKPLLHNDACGEG